MWRVEGMRGAPRLAALPPGFLPQKHSTHFTPRLYWRAYAHALHGTATRLTPYSYAVT